MRRVAVHDFAGFRAAARTLIAHHVAPRDVQLGPASAAQGSLFGEPAQLPQADAVPELRVPRRFAELCARAVLYRAEDRFDLAYRVLHRLTHAEPRLLEDEADPDTRALVLRAKEVWGDEHRMHAFVRFQKLTAEDHDEFVASYAPTHLIVRLAAPFFARRFASQRWTIFTPDETARWDGTHLHYGPGAAAPQADDDDALAELFRTYYAATFNPARVNLRLFQRHVPERFRAGLPELRGMEAWATAPGAVPEHTGPALHFDGLPALCDALRVCDGCELHAEASQAVCGEGPQQAALMLVGEQPGDEEDRVGRPFVGPAGVLLDRALAHAGIERAGLYVTNAVKHFRYRPVGKRRLHMKPEWSHVEACRPWLAAELALVRPRVVVCLGASAGQAFFGRRFSVEANRGRSFAHASGAEVLVTYHPSAVLRAPAQARADALYQALVADLTRARGLTENQAAG